MKGILLFVIGGVFAVQLQAVYPAAFPETERAVVAKSGEEVKVLIGVVNNEQAEIEIKEYRLGVRFEGDNVGVKVQMASKKLGVYEGVNYRVGQKLPELEPGIGYSLYVEVLYEYKGKKLALETESKPLIISDEMSNE